MKIARWYELWVVYEKDVCLENLPPTEDPITNVYVDKFSIMLENELFKWFIANWGSILKASDVNNEIFNLVATTKGQIYDIKKKQLEEFLDKLSLWEKRYMGEWQNKFDDKYTKDVINKYLANNKWDEEDKDWE